MRITVLLIFFISHLIFIPSVFGEGFSFFGLFGGGGFSLSCQRNYVGELPVKFKFSEDKNISWILLDDEWVELQTKVTDSYYYLSGLQIKDECNEYDKTGNNPIVHEYIVPFNYIIDRNTLKLFKKVTKEVNNSKCNSRYSPMRHIFRVGKDLESYELPCVVSKIKF